MVPLADLKPHPKNPNKHSEEQIKRLAMVFEHQGIRHPIIVSSLSGCIAAGHGRLAAAKLNGYTEFPVDVQHFETPEIEYQFLVSDNSLSDWSELDLSQINLDLQELGPFDVDLLGIESFTVDVAESLLEEEPEAKEEKKCPACGEIL